MARLLIPTALAAIVLSGFTSPARGDDRLPGIVFVSDDIFGAKYERPGKLRPGTAHWREGYLYHRATTQHPMERTTTPTRPGRNLYTLVPAHPAGTLTRITHLTDGEVFDPEPSYDGRRILFSMRRDGEDWFNLYEIGVDGTRLVQLTDGPFNDVSGVYLPDGRIVFVSDRSGYLEEYHEERTETLWIMGGDGRGIAQLTFNPGTVFDPTVLRDGRILFSLWDAFMLNIPGPDKHETYLMTIRPDGTEESHYFGARHLPVLQPRTPFRGGVEPGQRDARRFDPGDHRDGTFAGGPEPRDRSGRRPVAGVPRGHDDPVGRGPPTESTSRRSAAGAHPMRLPTGGSFSRPRHRGLVTWQSTCAIPRHATCSSSSTIRRPPSSTRDRSCRSVRVRP